MAVTEASTVRLEPDLRELAESYAAENGVSLSKAVNHFVRKGAESAVTPEDLDRILDERISALVDAGRADAERLDEALRQMGIARKNIGKATRASFGTLSMLSWLYRDLMVLMHERDPDDARAANWARRGPDYFFKFFEGAGGALQADPKTSYYPAFNAISRKEPFASMSGEEISGLPEDVWERMVGRGNDVAGVRSLADRGEGGR